MLRLPRRLRQRVLLATLLASGCFEPYESTRDAVPWEPPAPNAIAVLDDFRACMALEDFVVANVGIWTAVFTDEGQPCNQCHSDEYMFTAPAELFYGAVRYNVTNMVLLFTFHPASGGRVIVNEPGLAAASGGADDHPRFLRDDTAMGALADFHRLTTARLAAGQCR